jgi:putative ATPase
MQNLFEAAGDTFGDRPLADRMRPGDIREVVGQEHLLGAVGPIGHMVASGKLVSMILWGPPGCGKTTIARLLAQRTNYDFSATSAVFSGVSELRKVFQEAGVRRKDGCKTLMFVDEIHRFNRAQQDAFLPYIEDGTVTLIGATTQNPSFELIPALLSRCQVMVLHALGAEALEALLVSCEKSIGRELPLSNDARESLKAMSDGDGRFLLNLAEIVLDYAGESILDRKQIAEMLSKRAPLYDKAQEEHYGLISALHKSLRGSDVDASLYWLARMLHGGEDPLYIARRLVRFASEDVGVADPQGLVQALAAKQAYEFLGSPEGELALVQSVIFLATAPKSNALYKAFSLAQKFAVETGSLSPPKHILNAPTELMREQGYSEGYIYDHNTEDAFSGQNYFPDGIARQEFYRPSSRGYEREVEQRLQKWKALQEGGAR